MAKTNAERQAAFKLRQQQRLRECVSPDDVVRAARMIYDVERMDNPEEMTATFDEWSAKQAKARGGAGLWTEMIPHSSDPDDYSDALTDADRQFLARVGAVAQAVRFAPKS